MGNDSVYTERAMLVAHLAARHESCFVQDSNEPDWPVVLIDLPTGQVSWHIAPDDVKYFPHVAWDLTKEWDGHSTEEKYQRLNALTKEMTNVS